MKITQQMITERNLIKLYECSRKGDAQSWQAKDKIEKILIIFNYISVFTKFDHETVVKRLYFSQRNIMVIGTRQMADEVYIQERTLYSYRKKYCDIVDCILT